MSKSPIDIVSDMKAGIAYLAQYQVCKQHDSDVTAQQAKFSKSLKDAQSGIKYQSDLIAELEAQIDQLERWKSDADCRASREAVCKEACGWIREIIVSQQEMKVPNPMTIEKWQSALYAVETVLGCLSEPDGELIG